MSKTITVVGKGGVGKTAISALIVDLLSKKGVVLAIDADPSTNLNMALGLPLGSTVGRAREDVTDDIQKGKIPPNVSKQDLLDMKIREALVESKGFDLVVMGRPEGPGCYCYANTLLCKYLDILQKNYPYVVVDNEAGLEHISRLNQQEVDLMLVVVEPGADGLPGCGVFALAGR